jgi:hypothetical protein
MAGNDDSHRQLRVSRCESSLITLHRKRANTPSRLQRVAYTKHLARDRCSAGSKTPPRQHARRPTVNTLQLQ